MALELVYKDIALGADGDALTSTSEAESFSNIDKLPFGVTAPAIATCELNGWGLSRDYQVRDKQAFAFWSIDKSGDDCTFATPPSLSFAFDQQHTSTGITIQFAPNSMDYCTEVYVEWWQDGAVKAAGTYYPDSPDYLIERTVEAYDGLTITLNKTNLPGKRAKVEKVTFGAVRTFDGRELTGVNIIHEVSLISDKIPANILDASFIGANAVDYVFQRKQPVECYNNGELVGVYYIETGTRAGARRYSVKCSDAVAVLDLDEYGGGLWLEDTPLETILSEVFGSVFEFDIDPAYSGATLRGHIPAGTKRAALQAIAFALGAIVDTAGTNKIRLFPMATEGGATIPARDTYTGGTVTISDTVTEVTVTAYVITDERPADGETSVEFNGVKYRYYTDTKHAYNPNTVATDLPNKVKFDKSYLVNLSNAQTLANNIMAYYARREKYSFKHIMDGQTTGGRATATLPWGEAQSGNVVKMKISCTGIVVSDTELVLG